MFSAFFFSFRSLPTSLSPSLIFGLALPTSLSNRLSFYVIVYSSLLVNQTILWRYALERLGLPAKTSCQLN